MADKPDLDDLAKKYLDLWQEQLAGLASDEEIAKTMARTIELMNASGAAFASMVGSTLTDPALKQGMEQGLKAAEAFGEALKGNGGQNDDSGSKGQTRGQNQGKNPGTASPGGTAGTAAAGAASGPANAHIDDLASRLAELEKRIASLEGAPEKSRKRTPRKPAKG